MISDKKAISIIKELYPDLVITSALKFPKAFAFFMVPEGSDLDYDDSWYGLDQNGNEIFINPLSDPSFLSYAKHIDLGDSDDSLAHHGIKGQKWGVRRYQNDDGTLTAAGKQKHNQHNYIQFKKESKRGYDETTITKKFFNENKDLLNKMESVIEREKAAKYADDVWREKTALYDDLLSRGRDFLNKNIGNYKNKKISGLNVRHGRATVENLFFTDIDYNWYKHVRGAEHELDDWTR